MSGAADTETQSSVHARKEYERFLEHCKPGKPRCRRCWLTPAWCSCQSDLRPAIRFIDGTETIAEGERQPWQPEETTGAGYSPFRHRVILVLHPKELSKPKGSSTAQLLLRWGAEACCAYLREHEAALKVAIAQARRPVVLFPQADATEVERGSVQRWLPRGSDASAPAAAAPGAVPTVGAGEASRYEEPDLILIPDGTWRAAKSLNRYLAPPVLDAEVPRWMLTSKALREECDKKFGRTRKYNVEQGAPEDRVQTAGAWLATLRAIAGDEPSEDEAAFLERAERDTRRHVNSYLTQSTTGVSALCANGRAERGCALVPADIPALPLERAVVMSSPSIVVWPVEERAGAVRLTLFYAALSPQEKRDGLPVATAKDATDEARWSIFARDLRIVDAQSREATSVVNFGTKHKNTQGTVAGRQLAGDEGLRLAWSEPAQISRAGYVNPGTPLLLGDCCAVPIVRLRRAEVVDQRASQRAASEPEIALEGEACILVYRPNDGRAEASEQGDAEGRNGDRPAAPLVNRALGLPALSTAAYRWSFSETDDAVLALLGTGTSLCVFEAPKDALKSALTAAGLAGDERDGGSPELASMFASRAVINTPTHGILSGELVRDPRTEAAVLLLTVQPKRPYVRKCELDGGVGALRGEVVLDGPPADLAGVGRVSRKGLNGVSVSADQRLLMSCIESWPVGSVDARFDGELGKRSLRMLFAGPDGWSRGSGE